MLRWPTGGPCTIRSEVEGLLDLPAVRHVPQPDSSVPGCAGQNRLDRTEAQAAHRTLVAPQNLIGHSVDQSLRLLFWLGKSERCRSRAEYLKQLAGLHGPQEDLKGILRSSTHQLSTDIYSQGGELRRLGRRQRPEVSVPVTHKRAFPPALKGACEGPGLCRNGRLTGASRTLAPSRPETR